LLTHLGGTAKAAIDTAPDITPNSSYRSIVKALKEARRTPGERLQAEMDWKNLRIKDDESVADFVSRMRQIARRMAPEQAMDFQLGSKLYECLAHWKDSYYMLAALEAPEGQVFQEVRTVALRLERIRIAQKATQTPGNRRQIGVLTSAHQASSRDGLTNRPPTTTNTQPGGTRQPNSALMKSSKPYSSGQKQSFATLLQS
uniref:Zinc finger, CCHC-type, retrotransposon Gag domain protein n=1 Tax=Heligmosomoides polygyrus TaxID=6339 RepID=A0A183GVL9_HELPZ